MAMWYILGRLVCYWVILYIFESSSIPIISGYGKLHHEKSGDPVKMCA
jgi:hypothetical protein